jgi:hypothetical protein
MIWCSEGGRMVRLRLKPEEGTGMLFLKIDTSCHIEFLHLSTRMLCKVIVCKIQHACYVRRLRHFNKMTVKMLTGVDRILLLSMNRLFSEHADDLQLSLSQGTEAANFDPNNKTLPIRAVLSQFYPFSTHTS